MDLSTLIPDLRCSSSATSHPCVPDPVQIELECQSDARHKSTSIVTSSPAKLKPVASFFSVASRLSSLLTLSGRLIHAYGVPPHTIAVGAKHGPELVIRIFAVHYAEPVQEVLLHYGYLFCNLYSCAVLFMCGRSAKWWSVFLCYIGIAMDGGLNRSGRLSPSTVADLYIKVLL